MKAYFSIRAANGQERQTEAKYLTGIGAQCIHVEVVLALIKAKANLDDVDTDGTRPLTLASHNGYIRVVSELITAKANVNAAEPDGATPLCLAARNGHIIVASALIDAKADVNAECHDGATPLTEARKNRHLNVIDALTIAGAKDSSVAPCHRISPIQPVAPAEMPAMAVLDG